MNQIGFGFLAAVLSVIPLKKWCSYRRIKDVKAASQSNGPFSP